MMHLKPPANGVAADLAATAGTTKTLPSFRLPFRRLQVGVVAVPPGIVRRSIASPQTAKKKPEKEQEGEAGKGR